MPVQVSVDQAKLAALQKRLKEAGDKGLMRELNKALKAAAEPIAEDERAAALTLPSSGVGHTGMREDISSAVKVTVSRSKTKPGVRVASKARMARATARHDGWRHPLFGNTRYWFTQIGRTHWFSLTAMRRKGEVITQARKAMDDVAKKIARG